MSKAVKRGQSIRAQKELNRRGMEGGAGRGGGGGYVVSN